MKLPTLVAMTAIMGASTFSVSTRRREPDPKQVAAYRSDPIQRLNKIEVELFNEDGKSLGHGRLDKWHHLPHIDDHANSQADP